jgi:guanosine-3',5'-bis(diphosphate) 3'-pyrophosphohydrolase
MKNDPTHYVSDQIAEGPRCQVCGAIMTRAVGLSFYRCESCGEETQEPLLFKAIQLANVQHFGQRDKAGELYILHPLRVMLRMHTIQERIVAVLHDVVEDSEYPLSAIYTGFGHEIADAVDAVSRRVKHGRKELYLDFISRCAENPTGKAVKIADVLDNMSAERMGKLHSGMQKSLTHKYNKALRILGSAGTRETRGTPPPDMIQGGSMKFLISGSGVRVHEIELTDCELKDLGYCIQQLCEQKFVGEAAYGCTLLSVVAEKPQCETEIFWNTLTRQWECADCDWTDSAPASIIPGGHDCEKYNPREDDEIVKLHAEIRRLTADKEVLQALIEDYQKAVDGSGQHHLIAPENVKARFDELRAAAARVSQPVAPPPPHFPAKVAIFCSQLDSFFSEQFGESDKGDRPALDKLWEEAEQIGWLAAKQMDAAEPVAPGAEDDNELNKQGKEWLMLMREIVKLSDDEDELEADDNYLLAEFDPLHVLRRVIAERAAPAGTQPAQEEK